jgi:hypothetical protein
VKKEYVPYIKTVSGKMIEFEKWYSGIIYRHSSTNFQHKSKNSGYYLGNMRFIFDKSQLRIYVEIDKEHREEICKPIGKEKQERYCRISDDYIIYDNTVENVKKYKK